MRRKRKIIIKNEGVSKREQGEKWELLGGGEFISVERMIVKRVKKYKRGFLRGLLRVERNWWWSRHELKKLDDEKKKNIF